MGESPVRALILEDYEPDAQLIKRALARAGIEYQALHVSTGAEFEDALRQGGSFDVVIADYKLPGYSAESALE